MELGWEAEKGIDEMMASAWNWEKALAAKKSRDRNGTEQ
jgi:UDP-glucose 4-epimerase